MGEIVMGGRSSMVPKRREMEAEEGLKIVTIS